MSGLEEILYGIVVKINEYLSNYILVFLLIGVGLWYTIRTRFIQVRCFGEGMRRTFGNFKLKGFKHDSGMSSFQALATAIAALVAVMVTMKTEAERINEANEKYEEEKDKLIQKENEHRQAIDNLISAAGDETQSTDDRREALAELERQYPKIFAKYDTELEKLQNLKKIKEEIAQLDESNSITRSENELNNVQRRIAELEYKKQNPRKRENPETEDDR